MEQRNKILKNKRGVSIEMAIGFMLIIFALCAAITAVTLSMRARDRRTAQMTNDYFSLDQMGESFVNAVRNMGASANQNVSSEDAEKAVTDYLNSIKDTPKEGEESDADEPQIDSEAQRILEKYTYKVFYTPFEDKFVYSTKGTERVLTTTITHTRFSMKIWAKDEFESVYNNILSATGDATKATTAAIKLNPVLIVTVDRTDEIPAATNRIPTTTFQIINWSDQENHDPSYLDPKGFDNLIEEDDHNRGFHGLWLFLLALLLTIVVVVTILI